MSVARLAWTVWFVSILFLASSCTTKNTIPDNLGNRPAWVVMTSGRTTLEDKDGQAVPVVQGIGKVENIHALQLARSKADNEGRKQVAALFAKWIDTLMLGVRDLGENLSEEEWQAANQAVNMLDAASSPIVDRYVEKETRAWYSRAVSRYDRFVELIRQAETMPEKVKTYIFEHGKEAFEKLPESTYQEVPAS